MSASEWPGLGHLDTKPEELPEKETPACPSCGSERSLAGADPGYRYCLDCKDFYTCGEGDE